MKLEKKFTQIIEILNKVNGDNAFKKTTMFKLIKRFNGGYEDSKDHVRLGRSLTLYVMTTILNL